MRKKLLVLAIAGVMSASLMTACGGKETATTTAAETTAAETTGAETTVAATTAAEAETTAEAADAAEDKAMANFDEYIAWTNTEWSAANDDEKLNAAIAYSVYTTEALSGQTVDDETRMALITQMREAEDITNVVDQLNTTLPSFADMSLKDFADTAVEQINSMAETEAESK